MTGNDGQPAPSPAAVAPTARTATASSSPESSRDRRARRPGRSATADARGHGHGAPAEPAASAPGASIRPSRIRTIRCAAAATSRLWVTMRIVAPSRCSRENRSSTSASPSESRDPVGSSASSSVGRFASALAMATRWRWPPESAPGSSSAPSRSPSPSSRSRARAVACAGRAPPTSAASATFSSADMCSMRWKNWNTSPTWRRRSRASGAAPSSSVRTPARLILPSSASSSPASRCSSVDLPHPDGPMSATNSPRRTVRSTPRNARTGGDRNVLRSPRTTRSAPDSATGPP